MGLTNMKVESHKYLSALVLSTLIVLNTSFGQTKVFPPHWWVGMENDTIELLVYNEDGLKQAPAVKGNIQVLSSELAVNPNYAYVKLRLGNAKPQTLKIGSGRQAVKFELKSRLGFLPAPLNPADAMYLITPDRFANGDIKNDHPKGFKEGKYGKDKPYGRHGGDIKGIINHLDYIKDLGFNTLWVSPLVTNDQPEESYHGYAFTDHYSIDPRFGSNSDYAELVRQMHSRDMKMVMDVVYNHVGDQHLLFTDLPDSSFFNWHKGYEGGFRQTSYRAATLFDPHASESDKEQFKNGWFVKHMPDLNQRNPHVATFLIQNSIWWIEEFGVDAFRIDTYTYPDQEFMGKLAKSLKREYPGFFLFGETWVHGPEIQSYFPQGNKFNPEQTQLDAVTDFTLYYALQEALNQNPGWNEGITKVYYRLAADYLYDRPDLMVTFLDNHDLARALGHNGGDVEKLKTALGMLFTLRGIPCVYYGTEVLMKATDGHGLIREDFAGGWPSDTINKFTEQGRSVAENDMFNYIQKLLAYRNTSKALTEGKMTQFVPQDGVYVYFRHSETETVMVVVNANQENEKTMELNRFEELWPKGSSGKNILSGQPFSGSEIKLAPKSIQIIELN